MRQRNHRVLFRLNDKEYLHFIGQVEKSGFTQEKFLRGLIAGYEIQPRAPEGFAKMIALLSNLTNNVNQIARIANITQSIDGEQIARLQMTVAQMFRAGKELVGWRVPSNGDH